MTITSHLLVVDSRFLNNYQTHCDGLEGKSGTSVCFTSLKSSDPRVVVPIIGSLQLVKKVYGLPVNIQKKTLYI